MMGPFGNQIKFELVLETEKREKDKIGTYGIIKNPQAYILGSSIIETKNLFDYAFVLENIVLNLTTLGIGTCWLGGRFRKQEAMSHLSLAENEIIPAITPLGYAKEKKALRERMMRTILRAKNRKPEDQLFFYEVFGQPLGDRAEDFQRALQYVRVGPSAQNKQPWRLIFNTDLSQVHFYIASALADHPLYMCEPEYLDIGIAYNHFKTGLDEAGIVGELVTKEPEIKKPKGSFYIASWYRDY
jgi:nitroreductase